MKDESTTETSSKVLHQEKIQEIIKILKGISVTEAVAILWSAEKQIKKTTMV